MAGALATASVLGACSATPAAGELSFSYRGSADPGFIDQTLTITNRGGRSVAPTLEFVPVDANGREIPDIAVTTVFGSDRGDLVVLGGENYDILRFEGPNRERVANVTVSVADVRSIDLAPDTEPPDVEPLARGVVVSAGEQFDAVQITNDADVRFQVRVLLIEWDESEPGISQQAASVTDVIYAATVEPVSRTSFDITESAAAPVIERVAAKGGGASLKVIILAQ